MQLDTPVQFVRGVGPVLADKLQTLGIATVGDLIHYFPFRYEHRPQSQAIGTLRLDETATIVGQISRVRTRGSFGKQVLIANVQDATGTCMIRWFNSPYLHDKLGPGVLIAATGKVSQYRDLGCMTNPKYRIIGNEPLSLVVDAEQFDPVYPANASISSRQIARFIAAALPEVVDQLADPLPDELRRARSLAPRRTAVARYHLPTRVDDIEIARRRLAYDELLLMQLAVQLKRAHVRRSQQASPIRISEEIDRRIRARFGFQLTPGQESAVAEIAADLGRARPMRRLLQADVGAGKTAVALYAALAVIANRRQVVFLAPTEILAEQHHHKICECLAGSRVRVDLLLGNMPRKARDTILRSLADGKTNLVVGTHALLEESVEIPWLGLVIVDEQHRFGVRQRAKLRAKARDPHYLVLTATPIPRTLAMTVFGDLDVSTIYDLPPGRQPVETRLIRSAESSQAWERVRRELRAGRQAFVVYPLVERVESLPLKAAAEEVEVLRRDRLAGFEVELLHGQMPREQKESVMARFTAGEVQALAATTVVEVGIDVPNATVMVVHHAERFGLSQLHQLRGRVGRGAHPSLCLLLSDADNETALARLSVLCRTTDGFVIAEEDLRLRGPGEVVGQRQHGMVEFTVADLARDMDLLEMSRADATALIAEDESLSAPKHRILRIMLVERFGDSIALVDVA
ncbi:MAG: ATP-dependent DNA helicase RecG [Phycisphaerae bacterium]|nr:ATP-dependent DNA helicase RecG [Phycisphaerae bacterium]